jgi:4-amino-4-deoxy-L-arabinose transferase-like glycosyltransferase
VLVAACLALYFPGQRTLPVTDRDEARFMQATRQMVASGDFIVVRFQDELRAKKPAGIYWLQAAFVAGLSSATSTEAWPYRMPSLIAAITIVLLTFAFARKLFDDGVAWIAAGTLATSLLLGVEAHLATTDATLATLTVLAQGRSVLPRWCRSSPNALPRPTEEMSQARLLRSRQCRHRRICARMRR